MFLSLIAALSLNIAMMDTDIGRDNSFKAFMDYRTLTAAGSEQVRLQEMAWTDEDGYRRIGSNRYMVALGTAYTGERCGKLFTVVLEDGSFVRCITGDIKADEHTDEGNRFRAVTEELGCVVEFIVDTDILDARTKALGDCSTKFQGKIKTILKE